MEAILAIAIPIFVNMLSGCLDKKATPEDIKASAAASFNAATGEFDPQFIRKHRGRMRQCCKHAGQPHDKASVDAATVEMMTRAMNAEQPTLAAACAEAHGEDDDE